MNGVQVVRKLGYLRSLRIEEKLGIGDTNPYNDNAERLFAIVGLSLASVTKFITIALVFIFATQEIRKHLENVKLGIFCWTFLSALSTIWVVIEALYRTLSSTKTTAPIAEPLTSLDKSDLGVIMVDEGENEEILETLDSEIFQTKKKEMLLAWLFALAFCGFFGYCAYALFRFVRELPSEEDAEEDHKPPKEEKPREIEYIQEPYIPTNFNTISTWNRSHPETGFTSSPSTSISTISSSTGSHGKPGVGRRYTDIDDHEIAQSYKSGSMPYPTGQYGPGHTGLSGLKPHRYTEIDETPNVWSHSKIQMNQQITKEDLMQRCMPSGHTESFPKLTPGLETLLRTGEQSQLPIKSYHDSRQYTLRKTLPRNAGEEIQHQTAAMRMDKRLPSKEMGGAPFVWNEIVPYNDQVLPEAGAKNEAELPRLLSEQLDRAYHLDKKLTKALVAAECFIGKQEPTMSRTNSSRESRRKFRSVPIPGNGPDPSPLRAPDPVATVNLPWKEVKEEDSQLAPINNFRPRPPGEALTDPSPVATLTGLGPVVNGVSPETSLPPIPPRDHPGHYRCGTSKEMVKLGGKSSFDHEEDHSTSSNSTSIDGSISRSMSFASLNSKDSEFSRNSKKNSSLKCASLASQKKKVRFGNFQEEFHDTVEGLSQKRNTPAKSRDAT